jgi:hypothetical protein
MLEVFHPEATCEALVELFGTEYASTMLANGPTNILEEVLGSVHASVMASNPSTPPTTTKQCMILELYQSRH